MENEENQFPSGPQQMANFAGSFFNHAMNGFSYVDKKTFEERMDHCRGCEFYVAKQDRCSKCGCNCTKKASWSTTSCPVGKWKKET
jgi:hypothetical protein